MCLLAYLKKQGIEVSSFKVGPDFLDPMYLSKITSKCYNLDLFFSSLNHAQELLNNAAGIKIIEGVMGYYDGDKQGKNSTASLAYALDIPVFLIVEPLKSALSLVSIIYGFCFFKKEGRCIQGVILNRYTSLKQVELLEKGLREYKLPPLVGAFPKDSLPAFKSRHLGLKSEILFEDLDLELFYQAGKKYFFPEKIFQFFEKKPKKNYKFFSLQKKNKKIKLGIILDRAFNFYYQAQLEALSKRGIDLVFFSALQDNSLPKGLAGLYLGGGYPEIYAEVLSAKRQLCREIRDFALQGGKIYAECGGLIFLSKGIEIENNFYPFVGVLPNRAILLKKRAYLGYVKVKIKKDCGWFKKNTELRGHEFHYSILQENSEELNNIYEVKDSLDNTLDSKGYYFNNVLASYIHLYFAHREDVLENIVQFLKEN